MTSQCSTCRHKWFGSADKSATFAMWYCARRGDVRRKDMPVIGSDADLRAAKGCAYHALNAKN